MLGGSVGLDVPGTFSFASLNGTTGTVGTETVVYSWNSGSNTLTATGPRGALFTVVVTNPATGAYKVTLLDNVLHAGGPNQENATDPTTSLNYTITDADGSFVTGTLTITFDDDAPTAISPLHASLTNQLNASVTVALDGDSQIDNNVGADGPGTLTFVNIADGEALTDVNGIPLTSGGDPILLFVTGDGTVLEGRTGSASGPLVFTVTLNHNLEGSDTYTVTMFDTVDNGSGIAFSDLSGGVAGNPPFKIITEPGVSLELLFTPINAGSINSDRDDAGVGSQFIEPNQGLRIDFGDFTDNSGSFKIESHSEVPVDSFKFSIDQVSNGTHADVRLRAVVADIDNDFADDATVAITVIEIRDPSGALIGTFTKPLDVASSNNGGIDCCLARISSSTLRRGAPCSSPGCRRITASSPGRVPATIVSRLPMRVVTPPETASSR